MLQEVQRYSQDKAWSLQEAPAILRFFYEASFTKRIRAAKHSFVQMPITRLHQIIPDSEAAVSAQQ